MKRIAILPAIAALLMGSAACERTPETPSSNPYKSLELSTKSAEFVSSSNSFAFSFLDKIDEAESGDYVISPLSMQFLLGMLLNGAEGETADEISQVLGYGAGQTQAVNDFCLSLLQQLPALDKKTTLSIADAIFVNKAYPLNETYRSSVQQYYQAEVANLDFSDGAGSLKTINNWCKKQTNGLIPSVLDEVSPNMLAYLLNAVYFKSQWKEKFPKGNTANESFTAENGSRVTVPMMKQNEDFDYQDNDDVRVVRLPYGNRAFSMLVVLPQSGKSIADAIDAMQTPAWNELLQSMVGCDVDLWLPKFETKYSKKLNEILSDMGMPSAFKAGSADFSAMSDEAFCLSFVKQDAIIKVDEEGSEAAAISSAGMATSAAPGEHIVFHADSPFLYLITEASTGVVLFAGKYSGIQQ